MADTSSQSYAIPHDQTHDSISTRTRSASKQEPSSANTASRSTALSSRVYLVLKNWLPEDLAGAKGTGNRVLAAFASYDDAKAYAYKFACHVARIKPLLEKVGKYPIMDRGYGTIRASDEDYASVGFQKPLFRESESAFEVGWDHWTRVSIEEVWVQPEGVSLEGLRREEDVQAELVLPVPLGYPELWGL